jgi:hypothetical protein
MWYHRGWSNARAKRDAFCQLSVVRCPLLYEQKAQGIVASEKGPRRERQERINPGVRRKVTDFLTTENTKRSLLNRRQTQTTASAVSIVRGPLC